MRAYTFTQLAADELDRCLSACAYKAEVMSEKTSLPDRDRARWRTTFVRIEDARRLMRDMMHPQTRDETIEP